MDKIFTIALNQLLMMFIFLLVGFLLNKKKIIDNNSGRILSKLDVLVFMPAMYFKTMSATTTAETIASKLPYFVYGSMIMIVSMGIGFGVSRLIAKDRMDRAVYMYSLTVPNIVYFGYPIIEAVFGAEVLANAMIFCLPLTIFNYTVGINMFRPKWKFSLKQFVNPTLIAMALGMLVGYFAIPMPEVVTKACTAGSACLAPIAMLLTGFILAKIPFKTIFTTVKSYFVSIMRLILLPAFFGVSLYLFGAPKDIIYIAVAIYAMPLGLNSVVFPEAFGAESRLGAQSCFISNLMGMITIPAVFAVLNLLM